jgi:hypothetical protein
MADDVSKLRKELEDEYAQFRKELGKVLEAVSAVERAGPEDDIYDLLKRLEKQVEECRDGGVVGSGAKGHRKAREKYLEATR